MDRFSVFNCIENGSHFAVTREKKQKQLNLDSVIDVCDCYYRV